MTNQDLQNNLLLLLEDGCTVLAETERFVHQLQRQFRSSRSTEGKSGWEFPKIFTLNRWMEDFWTALWPSELPASSFFLRWKYLKECLDEAPPPEPLQGGVELIHLLDESFEQCLRYGLDPAGGDDANRLISWRRMVWRRFDERLSGEGLFHPALLPEKIFRNIVSKGRQIEFGRMAFAGFEFAGTWEKRLLDEMQKSAGAQSFPLPAGDAEPEHLVYPDPEQEVIGLMENLLLSAGECPPHEIAVVLPNAESYGPAISGLLRDILGEPLSGEAAAYNLNPDMDLSGQGLYSAALMPVRCALGGQKRNDLFSFLRSPYYGTFSRWNRTIGTWDRAWRENRIEAGFDRLLDTVRDSAAQIFPDGCTGIAAALDPFLDPKRHAVSHWAETLRRVWRALEFPQLANELDRIAWTGLLKIMSDFEAAFGGAAVSTREFHDFLDASARRVKVQKTGTDDAGFQILGGLDARGLAFRKIYIPGFVSGAFPRSARSLPLLSPSERKVVLGGTVESQFDFARYIYANLRAAAERIVISRPVMTADGENCIPSPFWTEEGEKRIAPVIPWKHKLPAMQRAVWVRQSASGIAAAASTPVGEFDRPRFEVRPLMPAGRISVSDLESVLICPAQYFFLRILGLKGIDEFEPGISPPERGQMVHSILASFVPPAAGRLKKTNPTLENLVELLKRTATDAIRPLLSQAVWQVELERLIGRAGSPGLLIKWLEVEWERISNGWSWAAVERQFDNLEMDGCDVFLKGRLDRIDFHQERGLICWDYKTGKVPGKARVIEDRDRPQLKAYLLALSKGSVTGVPEAAGGTGAGYIELRSPANMKHQVVFDPADSYDELLKNWEKEASAALNSLFAGDITPRRLKSDDPCPESCECGHICGFF